jgi:hypothetical protein
MTITTSDQFINALGNNSSRIIIDKASLANWAQGNYYSLWRATGQPGQGATPTTPAVCDNTLVGAIQFTQQTSPMTSYLAILECVQPTAAVTFELHDRLMHDGPLVGNSTASQPVDLDMDLSLGTSNLSARKGDANYSDVQWWLEWYADTGGTASNATVNVTYNDNSSGNLTTVAVGGTVRATRMIALNSLIPSGDSGKYIMRVNTIQLSASTGTAGNFGVTATRYRAAVFMPIGNARFTGTYADLGLPEIPNSSCLFAILIAGTTSSGIVKATGKIIHG